MSTIFIDPSDGMLAVKDSYADKSLCQAAGCFWDSESKLWKMVFTIKTFETLLKKIPHAFIDPSLNKLLAAQNKKEDKLAEIRKMAEENQDINFRVMGLKQSPFPYQKIGILYASVNQSGLLIGDEMGLGKQVVFSTPILTENGWKEIGKVVKGEMVYSRDGKLYPITGIYPQGVNQLLKIEFSDGVSAECGWEHLWLVMDNNDFRRGNPWKVKNTRELEQDLFWGKKKISKWRIPIVEPIQFKESEVLIPPYLLGVLLGDGNLTKGGISFVPGDKEVPNVVSSFLPKGYFVKECADYGTSTSFSVKFTGNGNPMSEEITRIGLRLKGENKFIPDLYLNGSVNQRKNLLAGLLDTDGTVKGARTRFSTSSEKLADDMIYLVQSLGGLAVKSLVKGRLRDREGKISQEMDNWQLTIRLPFNPFLTPRNKNKWRASSKLVRTIKSITPIREEEAICISVASPDSTYILKDFIVTHNTVQGLATALVLKNKGFAKQCLVVTPASLKYNWPLEVAKFTDEKCIVIDGKKPEDRIAQWLDNSAFFKVANYELVVEDLFGGREFREKENETEEEAKKRMERKAKQSARQRILSDIRERVWDLIIMDEVHFLKHGTSKRYKALKAMKAKMKIGLSGTPMDGKLEELYTIMNILAPGVLGSRTSFFTKHVTLDFFGAIKGYKNIKDVQDKIAPFFLRRLKRNILKQLPDKIYENKIIALSDEEKRIYNAIKKGKHESVKDAEAVVRAIRCKQFCNFPQMLEPSCKTSSKLDAFREVLEEVIQMNGNKAIIFSQYKEMVNVLVTVIEEMKLKYLRIDGDTDKKLRADYQQKFNTDNTIDCIIGTEAMSTGLNLVGANYVINYDDNWQPAIMAQRQDRAHRLGQKDVVTCVSFVCKDTIEEHIRGVLYSKDKITSETLGDGTDEAILKKLGPKELEALM